MKTRIYQSIRDVDPVLWDSTDGDQLSSHAMMTALEQAGVPGVRTRYAMIRDRHGRLLAAAPLSCVSIDAQRLTHGLFRSVIKSVQMVSPGFLKTDLMICGTPLSVGNSPVRIARGANRTLAIHAFSRALELVAEEERISWRVFKEFHEEQMRPARTALEPNGWLLVPSEMGNRVAIRWSTYEDYLASLRSPYRRKIRNASRQLIDRGIHVEECRISEGYDAEHHSLYEAVVDRAPIQLERLNQQFFLSLGRVFGRRARLLRFVRDRRVVGWVALLCDRGVVYDLFHGISYQEITQSQLYFNQLAETVRFAIEHGAHRLELGQSSNVAKARFGSRAKPLWVALRHTNPILRALLRAGRSRLFPHPIPPKRRSFHVAEEPLPTRRVA